MVARREKCMCGSAWQGAGGKSSKKWGIRGNCFGELPVHVSFKYQLLRETWEIVYVRTLKLV